MEALTSFVSAFGIGALVAAVIFFLWFKRYLRAYLGRKGKNLATRDDIAKMAREVGILKGKYRVLIEELRGRYQLRTAAAERRLEAHQEAFTHWRELMKDLYGENVGDTAFKCQEWWEKNCLFLEPTAREAFMNAIGAALMHRTLTRPGSDRTHGSFIAIDESWERCTAAGDIILKAVALPGLTPREWDELRNAKEAQLKAS